MRTQLKITNCNLYNLNMPNKPIYRDKNGWSDEEFGKKVDWLSEQLQLMHSDIWGFQELWHQEALEKCFEAANLDTQYELLVPPNQTGQRIVCAAAVNKEILVGEPEWIVDFPDDFTLQSGGDDAQTSGISINIDRFSRSVLHFKIKPRTNGKQIHVFVCHFKSKNPTKVHKEPWYSKPTHSKHATNVGSAIATIRRTAEASALRFILTELMKKSDTPVIVLGDLNDAQHSNTLNILTEQPNYLLAGYQKGGSDVGLYTVGTLQEYRSLRDVYYTHIYKNIRESLDHILVSQEFYDNSKHRLWAFKGMSLANDHLNFDNHKQVGSSDHAIVQARFEYRPA